MARLKRIDLKLETDGVWKTHADGWSVLVRSAGAPRVERALSDALVKRLGELGTKSLTTPEAEDVVRDVYAREVLLDWKDIDEAPTFSVERAVELLRDPELRVFHTFVASAALDASAYERKGIEAVLGNSLAGSPGT